MPAIKPKIDYVKELTNIFNPLTEEQQAIFFNEIKKMYKQKIEMKNYLLSVRKDIELDKDIVKFDNNEDGFDYLESLIKCE